MSDPIFPPPPSDHAAKGPWLAELAHRTREQHRATRSRSMLLGWIRFLTFAGMPAGGYFYYAQGAWWGPIAAVSALVAFWLSVRVHRPIQAKLLNLRLLQDIIDESQQRIGGEPLIIRNGLEPTARPLWSPMFEASDKALRSDALSAQEAGDLDLFGDRLSLFGLLNRTSTSVGQSRLAHVLTHPLLSPDAIRTRQIATQWMTENPAERFQLMAAAAAMRPLHQETCKLYETIRDATPALTSPGFSFLRLWSLAAPVALALGIANQAGWNDISVGWLPLVIVLIINVILIQLYLKPARRIVRPWLDLDTIVARLRHFAATAAQLLPRDGLLAEQHQRLTASLQPGCLPALERRIPLLFLGLSGIMHTLIDVLVFWDFQMLRLLEGSYIRHRSQLIDALIALGHCELFASLGTLAWEQETVSWPQFSSDGPRLEIDDGRHPLIAPTEAVANSLKLGGSVRTWLITGSNMSGKSTFLRMAATNVLLAQIGSATTTRRITLSPLEIMTDLRVRDELSKKESYFLAEVRQVRRMVEAARSNRPVFALIDEPFRGTNSAERVAAASAVVTSLINGSGLHLIATHDAALTSLGDADNAANYHFQESFEQENLVFDYKLRTGPAQSRNALRVLQAEGYPKGLLELAKRILDEDLLST